VRARRVTYVNDMQVRADRDPHNRAMQAYLDSLVPTVRNLILMAAIFVPLERFFALRRERVLRREFWNDIGYNLINGLFLSTLMAVPIAVLARAAQHLVPAALIDAAGTLPYALRVPLVLVVGDIGTYWGHRWSHQSRLLWRFHKIHHSPTHVDWLVNTRAHPVDLVFTRLCGLALLFATGLAQTSGGDNAMPLLWTLFSLVWSFFIHANVRWRFGWLEYLIATPAFHHWHHTNDDKRDHNYAAIFPFVDMMFGSFHLPPQYPSVYGVDEPPEPTLWAQLIDPFLPAGRKP
jgi:sterol desaturase/sphingolipid hydroxylase (fatty acid hydroxylase superfamily)